MSGARVTYSTHISHSGASRIPSGEMTSLADQQQLARQRRRFYRHILLPELPTADLHIRRSRRRPGPPPSAYLHRRGDASGSAVAAFTVCRRASLCPVALIAAGSCERSAGSGARNARRAAPKAPLTRPPGSGSWPAGARGRTCGGTGGFGFAGAVPFLPGPGVTCSMTGRGRRGGSQAYLGPRARAAPGGLENPPVRGRAVPPDVSAQQ